MLPDTEVKEAERIDEYSGKLGSNNEEDKLMKSVFSNDKEKIDDGKLISDSINQGLGSFTPDLMFENLVKNYQTAKQIYGERIIRNVTGYDTDYIERNRKIPEFQKELKNAINSKITRMRRDKLIDKDGTITKEGMKLSSVVVYLEELEHLKSYGILGEKINKKSAVYGERNGVKKFRKGSRYKDINTRSTVKLAIKRGHEKINMEDLQISERKAKGSMEIIYAVDSSASMKGKKIEMAKKAGIALAFKAIEEKNKVGLIVFGDNIKKEILPTMDFTILLKEINSIRASNQTNITKTIEKAYELFSKSDITKHLLIITDALPTEGDDPYKETIEACGKAHSAGITISVIGIGLEDEGKRLAEKLTEIGNGRLSIAKNIDELDLLVLEDYARE